MTEQQRHRHPFRNLMLLVFLLLTAFAATSYAMGWLKFDSQPEKATIEIETGEMKEAANQAADKTENLIEQAGEALKDAGESVSGDESAPDAIEEEEAPALDESLDESEDAAASVDETDQSPEQ